MKYAKSLFSKHEFGAGAHDLGSGQPDPAAPEAVVAALFLRASCNHGEAVSADGPLLPHS